MRRYETIIIIDPDVSEDQRKPVFERIYNQIEKEGGFPVSTDEWGNRKLAYEIKKKQRGYYVLFEFCGTNDIVDEMERFFRIDDRVLKYMTVLLDKSPDIEKIKEELAKAESEKTEEIPKEDTSSESSPPDAMEPDTVAETETVEAETTSTDIKEEE